ncbi:hypothetical protein RJ640_026011 [Escallonia rubra]|uniref:Cytochrome P450 87A3 n=1 Tax=Escallonia rubra TaxID=112253 RepID=A0AA88UWV1_9ASTE|nr:hypothetical protein RJ640_026011 [Escallonia rubra]
MRSFICFIAIVVIWISHKVYRWGNPKSKGVLPPGSMGLPFVGETIQFFSPHRLYDIPPFISKRVERYGTLFRTSLVGRPVVVSTDPETNYYIFQQEGKYFQCWYTESFIEILGQQSVLAYHGVIHKYLKNLILSLVSPENLKEKLLHDMDGSTRNYLRAWSNHGEVDVKEAAADMIFEYFAKKLFSYDETKACKKLRENYKAFIDGLISFPLNFPGTAYHACLQGRKNATKVIKDAFSERRSSKEIHNDFMNYLLEEVNKEETFLTEGVAVDLVFVLLFATYETTSAGITLLTKFLSDNPAVLRELTKEHEAILRSREKQDSTITWREYKSMTFTHMVINETVRLANIVPGIFRRVIKEVELKGYTVPAGWVVMVCPSSLHLNPDKYGDPLAFNPWRWEWRREGGTKEAHVHLRCKELFLGQEMHAASKDFMAFGGGVRLCVGADFAKLQMAIYLHYLVTKYRWTVIRGGDIIRRPGLVFPNGLHIEISEKQKCSEPNDAKEKVIKA